MKILVVWDETRITLVDGDTAKTIYTPTNACYMLAPHEEIKTYLESKNIDTQPIDDFINA